MDFVAARRNMVACQIRANGVVDGTVVEAMAATPREVFLPQALHCRAYADDDLDLGGGRWLAKPLALGRLLQAAAVQGSDVALVVGDAAGYLTALVARQASYVIALGGDGEAALRLPAVLTGLGLDNVDFATGPLAAGYPARAPYDVVVLAGAVSELPAALGAQLAEGGRLAAVVRAPGGPGQVVLAVKSGDALSRRPLFDVSIPLLPELAPSPGFVF